MAENPEEQKNEKQPEPPAPPSNRRFIVIGVVVLLVLGAAFFYWRSTFTEDTDDAQVDGNLYQISSRIQGHVVAVNVSDNQMVKKGDVLAEIDPTDYQVTVDQAEADLAAAQAQYVQASTNVPITSTNVNTAVTTSSADVQGAQSQVLQAQKQVDAANARVVQATANSKKADDDVARYAPLVAKDVISKQQYDAAVAAAAAAKAQVTEAEAGVLANQNAVTGAQQKLAQAEAQSKQSVTNRAGELRVEQSRAQAAAAQVKQAQARVQQAKLNLSYTKIIAPTDGIINKKNVEVGANLSAGQDLMTIIPLTNLWVTANFKETQLEHMQACQKVELKVDAYGGRKFTGVVRQIGGATGSQLSLFPPENATGNYVKVVQRIPVRIDFTDLAHEDQDYVLRPGLSVTPDIAVKDGLDQNCVNQLQQAQNVAPAQ